MKRSPLCPCSIQLLVCLLFCSAGLIAPGRIFAWEGLGSDIATGNIDGVEKKITAEPKLINQMIDGMGGPLHQAAFGGKLDIAKLLIDRGAKINLETKLGWTPLYWAIEKSDQKMAAMLLEAGANADQRNASGIGGYTCPLDTAVGKLDLPMIKLLVDHGADPDGTNALCRAIGLIAQSRHNKESATRIANYLLDQGADPAHANALTLAARYADFPLFQKMVLLRKKANEGKFQQEYYAENLLSLASADLAKVKFLVEQGHHVHRTDLGRGSKPVLVAVAEHGNVQVLEYLLQNGFTLASPEPKVISSADLQRRALDRGIENNHADMVRALLGKDVAPTLPALIAVGDLDAARSFLEADPDSINSITMNDGRPTLSPLHVAVLYRRHEILKMLLAKTTPAQLNRPTAIIEVSPLHQSTALLDLKATKMLLQAGADPNARLSDSLYVGSLNTPLDLLAPQHGDTFSFRKYIAPRFTTPGQDGAGEDDPATITAMKKLLTDGGGKTSAELDAESSK